MKFQVGDTVKRINYAIGQMYIGTIGVVTEVVRVGARDLIALDGRRERYDADNFELVFGNSRKESFPAPSNETACLRCSVALAVKGLDGFCTHCRVVEDNRALKLKVAELEKQVDTETKMSQDLRRKLVDTQVDRAMEGYEAAKAKEETAKRLSLLISMRAPALIAKEGLLRALDVYKIIKECL